MTVFLVNPDRSYLSMNLKRPAYLGNALDQNRLLEVQFSCLEIYNQDLLRTLSGALPTRNHHA